VTDNVDFDLSDTRAELFDGLFDDAAMPVWRAAELGMVRFRRSTPCVRCGGYDFVRYTDHTAQDGRDKIKCHACKGAEQKTNRANYNKLKAQRRAAKLKATPKWLTTSQLDEIKAMYVLADELTKSTGIPHQVDHIVPLQGSNVCGLHVPWNLQVIAASKNASKGNKFDPDSPVELERKRQLLEKLNAG
jgi:hypothetical protein